MALSRLRRSHWLPYWALLAMLCQGLLPTAHAQLMAAQSGGTLAGLVCGVAHAEFLASLRDQLPPEFLGDDEALSQAASAAGCPACAGAHADVPPPVEAAQRRSPRGLAPVMAIPAVAAGSGRHAYPPPARGPPA